MSFNPETKLIVLRGPSGSGKSTLAKRVLRETSRNVVVLEQDLYRKKMTRNTDSFKLRQEMVRQDCLLAFDHGHDVVLDGIFNIKHHDVLFQDIMAAHPDNNHFFYFDVPFDETVRRHQTRDKINEFGHEEMADWYAAASPTGYRGEVIIPTDSTEDETFRRVNEITNIVPEVGS